MPDTAAPISAQTRRLLDMALSEMSPAELRALVTELERWLPEDHVTVQASIVMLPRTEEP